MSLIYPSLIREDEWWDVAPYASCVGEADSPGEPQLGCSQPRLTAMTLAILRFCRSFICSDKKNG